MKNIVYFILALLLVALGVFVFTKVGTKSSLTINTSGPAVVKQLQSLNRFETTSFKIEKIIDAGTSYNDLRQFLIGDKLLLVAYGEVIAGFDLSKLKNDDIEIEKEVVTLNLPKPEILVTRLDGEKTRVYDRDQGILNKGDKDLETKARAAAEQSIKEAACQEKILDEAAKNGRNQLTALLKALGFTTVVVNIPGASC